LGLETVPCIAAGPPEIAIIVPAAVSDTAQRMALRKAGARQILDKGLPSEQLVKSWLLHAMPVVTRSHV
jgi:DNA-binding NarL/FixJ family response regulator